MSIFLFFSFKRLTRKNKKKSVSHNKILKSGLMWGMYLFSFHHKDATQQRGNGKQSQNVRDALQT